MDKFPQFKPGQMIGLRDSQGRLRISAALARVLNRIVDEVQRLGKVSVTPPLGMRDSASGINLSCDLLPTIMGKLTGSGNPYDFVQQVYNKVTGVFSDLPGGRTGIAYESTEKTGLNGKVVQLKYELSSGDWRFHYVGVGACLWTILVRNSCTNALLSNAVVQVFQDGVEVAICFTTGQVITVTRGATGANYTSVPTVTISGSGSAASAVANMQVGSIVRTSGGSGYTDGSYVGTFSGGGGSGATFSFTVSGGAVQSSFSLTTQGSGYTSPPTPNFSAAGPGTGAAAMVRLNVRALILTAGGNGYTSATVGFSGGGGSGATGSATVRAQCTLEVPAGTYDLVVTSTEGEGYATYSASVGHFCGQTTTVSILPDEDHACGGTCGYGCAVLPRTAYLTWSYDDGYDRYDSGGNLVFKVKFPDATLTLGPQWPAFGTAPTYWSEPFDLDVGPPAPGEPHQHITARYLVACLGPYITWISQDEHGVWSTINFYAGGPGTSTAPGNHTCNPFAVTGGLGDTVFIGEPGRPTASSRWTYSA